MGKSPDCLAAGFGEKEVELEIRTTDSMLGGTVAAGPAQDLHNQQPSPHIVQKKIGLGIY